MNIMIVAFSLSRQRLQSSVEHMGKFSLSLSLSTTSTYVVSNTQLTKVHKQNTKKADTKVFPYPWIIYCIIYNTIPRWSISFNEHILFFLWMKPVELYILKNKEQTVCTVLLIFIDFFKFILHKLAYILHIHSVHWGWRHERQFDYWLFLGWAKVIQGKKNVKRKYKTASNYFQLSSPPSAKYRNKT